MNKLLLLFTFFASIPFTSFAQLPTPDELDSIQAEDEHVSSKTEEIESQELVRSGKASVCSISGPGNDREMTMQQSECTEVIESMRQDFCLKWIKSAYTIKHQSCKVEDWKVVKGTCTTSKELGVGFCQ